MVGTASDTGRDTAGVDDAARLAVRQRLRGEDRRAALAEAAIRLLVEEGIDAVTMETVATRAGVSRPLVYKHFANRDVLLAEAYRREATRLDAAIVAAVEAASGFEAKLRAVIRAVLDAETTHGPLFGSLARAGVRDRELRREQRARDRRTVRFFAALASEELGLDKTDATTATAVLLTGMEAIQAQWRARPTRAHRRFLEDLYVDLVIGGLTSLAARRA